MRIILRKFVSVFLTSLLAILGTSLAEGADSIAPDPIQLMNMSKPTSGARGIVFIENISAGTSIGWIRYSHIPKFNSDGSIEPSDYWDWSICNSWSDSNCPKKVGYAMEGKVVLGVCESEIELGCLDNFKVFNSFGAGLKLTHLGKSFSKAIDIPQDNDLGIPRSSSPAVYQDSEGNLYVIRASLWVYIYEDSKPTFKLDVDITPVVKISEPSLGAPRVEAGVEPRTGKRNVYVVPSPSECISTDVGICYKAIMPKSELKYSVSVRVPRSVSGWLRGRVSEPNFDVQLLNEKSQVLTISAKPVRIPIAGGWITFSQLPSGFIEKIWPSGGYDPNPNAAYFLVANPSQGDQGMREYSSWAPYLKEKAIVTTSNWSFGTNMDGSEQPCLRVPGEISGFVASNASVYSSKPPEWDAGTSTLTYKVASPHLDENGVVNSGTYTLAMPLSSIKCLYGKSSLPPSATVSISYGSEVVNVATVTLKSDSGWINFSANGFHYSEPTIKVKLGDSGNVPIPEPTSAKLPGPQVSSSPASNSAASPTSSADSKTKVLLITQWCAKGNLKRKVVGLAPSCPKGYKKISGPTAR